MNPDFGLKSNALTNWLFRAETDLLTDLFLYQRFFCVCSLHSFLCALNHGQEIRAFRSTKNRIMMSIVLSLSLSLSRQ